MRLRALVYELIEDEDNTTPAAKMAHAALVAVILVAVISTVLETVSWQDEAWSRRLALVELACLGIFIAEYGLRLWACVEDRAGRYSDPLFGRLRYMATPSALVDLVAILPAILAGLGATDLLLLRLLRILRILKVVRYSAALVTFQVVVYNERRQLASAALLILVMLLLAAGAMHAIEGRVQPEHFGSIPAAMYWAAITLATVGYGDVTPITPLGKLLSALVGLSSIAALAVPTAILGAGFVRETQKQDFLSRASMVARVPLFRHLPPAQLAEVTGLLHLRTLPPRYTVIHRGEHPEAMYFIDQGRVIMRLDDRRIVLHAGSFFGEMALLEGRPREASVVTLTACRLLELQASDFHRLIGGDPTLREVLIREARQRVEGFGSSTEARRAGEPAAPTARSVGQERP